jgi:shikimate dehydrogenase
MSAYGLLGEKLTHSFSPQIHALLGDYPYRLFEIAPQDVHAFLLKREFDGINVTIPYKKTVIPYCDELSDAAKRIGSVNTILRRADGKLTGHNTDYAGFDALLERLGFDPSGKKAVILGSGGSSVTVKAVLEDRRASRVVVISRTGRNNYHNLFLHADAALIVNTTPVGMYPDTGAAPVSLDSFPGCEAVIDIIYNPARTRLLLDAQAKNLPAINGLVMLVAQAKAAAELFTGRPIIDSHIDVITETIRRQTMNIVLIGMPSCGKSTIGKALASQLGRPFIDLDTRIEERAGRGIPDIIQRDGETAFRDLETNMLEEISRQSGAVIAAGGGIVTVPGNLPLIRQNSVCVFLKRDLAKLRTDGRPLSVKYGVDALYKARFPLYQAWGDYTIDGNGSIEHTAKAVREALKL